MIKLNFRLAEFSDIPTLVELINQSYREQQGRSWTTEVEYVKGQRINKEQLKHQLELPNSVLDLLRKSLLQVHPIYQCSD